MLLYFEILIFVIIYQIHILLEPELKTIRLIFMSSNTSLIALLSCPTRNCKFLLRRRSVGKHVEWVVLAWCVIHCFHLASLHTLTLQSKGAVWALSLRAIILLYNCHGMLLLFNGLLIHLRGTLNSHLRSRALALVQKLSQFDEVSCFGNCGVITPFRLLGEFLVWSGYRGGNPWLWVTWVLPRVNSWDLLGSFLLRRVVMIHDGYYRFWPWN